MTVLKSQMCGEGSRWACARLGLPRSEGKANFSVPSPRLDAGQAPNRQSRRWELVHSEGTLVIMGCQNKHHDLRCWLRNRNFLCHSSGERWGCQQGQASERFLPAVQPARLLLLSQAVVPPCANMELTVVSGNFMSIIPPQLFRPHVSIKTIIYTSQLLMPVVFMTWK